MSRIFADCLGKYGREENIFYDKFRADSVRSASCIHFTFTLSPLFHCPSIYMCSKICYGQDSLIKTEGGHRMKAYLSLIKEALKRDMSIDVYSEEGKELTSSKYTEVKDMVENLDMCSLRFYDKYSHIYRGSAVVNLCVDDDETVSDHSMNYTRADCHELNSDQWIEVWFDREVMGR